MRERVAIMFMTLAIFGVLTVAASLLGGMLPLATVLGHTRLQIYLSFSAGIMLGAVFFHMLPEAVEIGSPATIRWTILGLLSLFFVERFFSFHQHEPFDDDAVHDPFHDHDHPHPHGDESKCNSAAPANPRRAEGSPVVNHGNALQWTPAAIGLAIHSLTGGIALASAVSAQQALGTAGIGWGVFLATAAHKPADALTIVSLMLRAGVPHGLTHLVNLGFALMVPLGMILFSMGIRLVGPEIAHDWTSAALAFSAGTFLCISLSDLLPELQFHSHDRLKLSISLLAGIGLMALSSSFE